MKPSRIAKIIGFVILGIGAFFLFGFLVMLLWNNLLPGLFHFPVISLWQALGLLILFKIFFGGMHGAGAGRHHWKRNALRRKWMNMTPEEREQFKHDWSNRCRPSSPEPQPEPWQPEP